MRKILLTTVFSIVALPALASWDRVASIDVSAGAKHELTATKLDGNVIGLSATQSDVVCDRVSAVYSDGEVRPIFRGVVPKGLAVRVDLPPGILERGAPNCHAANGQGQVQVAADTGGQDAYRRG